MRKLLLAAILLSFPHPMLASGGEIRLVSETNGELVVAVNFDSAAVSKSHLVSPFLNYPGLPQLHYQRFFVALPYPRGYSVEILGGESFEREGPLPELAPQLPGARQPTWQLPETGFFPDSPLVVSGPFYFRKNPVIAIDCFAAQVDYGASKLRVWPSYSVRVRYPKLPGETVAAEPDPLVSKLVVNKEFARLPRDLSGRGRRQNESMPDPHFDLSTNWVKIEIDTRAMYVITGNDLYSMGFSLAGIDPSTFRLFTAGGINQSRAWGDTTGTWRPGKWMKECSIDIRNGGDGTFDPQDSLAFYAMGAKDWLDLYQAAAPDTVYYDHLYSSHNMYFLTWGGAFGGTPARMDSIDAAPSIASYVRTFVERLYFEKDIIKNFNYGGDGWLWLDVTSKSMQNEAKLLPVFQVKDLAATKPQTFRSIALSWYCGTACSGDTFNANQNHHAVYNVNGIVAAEKIWNTSPGDRYKNGLPVAGKGYFLQEGDNRLVLVIPRDLNPKDYMYFDWYSVFYHRRLVADGNQLAFSSPDTIGTVNFQVDGFTGTESLYLFDVTDQINPRILRRFEIETDVFDSRTVRFASAFVGSRKQFWACTESSMKRPLRMTRYSPQDLRNVTSSPHLLIIHHKDFGAAADKLRAYRQTHLPYYQSPQVLTANCESVFDNFSGGVPDPMAIRNYCKFLYDNFTGSSGSPRLSYLLLLGDANTDYKNFASVQPNYVITNLNLEPSGSLAGDAYATDDWFVLMDTEDEIPGYAIPDVAVGRLPAANPSEASFLVDKIVDYETSNDYGPWRSKVVLVADDEISGTLRDEDDMFIYQSEILAIFHLPFYIDIFKLYLTEFPRVAGIKKESRETLITQWNDGALLINYIGHGSAQQMADEQVFLGSDVGRLNNGTRLPLLVALSCTIGDFDNASARSLSEKLILHDNGGVIATVAASQVTYITPNFIFNFSLFDSLFTPGPGYAEALGTAMILAKLNTIPAPQQFIVENNEKYNLLGDPALRLAIPQREVQFYPEDVDTIVAGMRESLRGTVLNGSAVDTTFAGIVHLFVRESNDTSGYRRESDGFSISYDYPGGIIYKGTSDVVDGEFEFNFHVPRYPSMGPYSYVMAYAYRENGYEDAATTKKDVKLVYPSGSDSSLAQPIDGAPRIELGFKGGITKIKPGAILQAIVHDADGINILSTTNEGKQALLLDQTMVPLAVTDSFYFYHGGSDTAGVLRYPLEDISVGDHRAIYKVSDSFGQIAMDTLSFTVVDPLEHFADAVFNYPNPFSSDTRFLFHLSGRATIELDIFTTSGKRIRSLKASRDVGEAWIYWDGKDFARDAIANGVYLYIARVIFAGVDTPAKVVRGKLVKVE